MSSITAETVLAALTRHIGRENGIQIETLVWEAAHKEPTAGRQRKAREIVAGLRCRGHHICAHPNDGYYIAATADELDATCEWLLSRSMKTLTQIAAMKRTAVPDLRGQLNLLRDE